MTKKQIFCLILAFLIGLGLANLAAAQTRINGPDQTRTGTLAIFEIMPNQTADWTMTPTAETQDTFQVDSAGDKLYFASPNAGAYTIACAIVVEGKAQLLTHAFVNIVNDEIKPSPDPPDPPGPKPAPTPQPEQPLAVWIKTELPKLVKSQNLQSEQQLVAQCFHETVQKIETGTIKTAHNARTQLQVALTMSLAFASDTAIDDWQLFLSELSRKMAETLGDKVNNIDTVKTVFEQVEKALDETVVVKTTSTSLESTCPACQRQPTNGRMLLRMRSIERKDI